MSNVSIALNDPRLAGRVAELYRQLRARVEKLRALQTQLDQGRAPSLTPEQRAQLAHLPAAMADLRELREGRLPSHPIALLTHTAPTTSPSTPSPGKTATQPEVCVTPDVNGGDASRRPSEGLSSSLTHSNRVPVPPSGRVNKSALKTRQSTAEEDFLMDVKANDNDDNDLENTLTRFAQKVSAQSSAKARNAVVEQYVQHYLTHHAPSPALLQAAERKLQAALECKKRVLHETAHSGHTARQPSRRQLETIEQLPALRQQVASCTRRVRLDAEQARAALLARVQANEVKRVCTPPAAPSTPDAEKPDNISLPQDTNHITIPTEMEQPVATVSTVVDTVAASADPTPAKPSQGEGSWSDSTTTESLHTDRADGVGTTTTSQETHTHSDVDVGGTRVEGAQTVWQETPHVPPHHVVPEMDVSRSSPVPESALGALVHRVAPTAHVTIQPGSEWGRVLRYRAPTDASGTEFTLRGFYSLIPPHSPLAQPSRRASTRCDTPPAFAVAETRCGGYYARLQLSLSACGTSCDAAAAAVVVDEHTRCLVDAVTAPAQRLQDFLQDRPLLRARLEAERARVRRAALPDVQLVWCGLRHTSSPDGGVPHVCWLCVYTPASGPLTGWGLPLEVEFSRRAPFAAPRVYSLVHLPHPGLVVSRGGRPNLLYLLPTTGTSSGAVPWVSELLSQVGDFVQRGLRETCAALGADGFAAQLRQTAVGLHHVWLALCGALRQGPTSWKGWARWMRWCNGPFLCCDASTTGVQLCNAPSDSITTGTWCGCWGHVLYTHDVPDAGPKAELWVELRCRGQVATDAVPALHLVCLAEQSALMDTPSTTETSVTKTHWAAAALEAVVLHHTNSTESTAVHWTLPPTAWTCEADSDTYTARVCLHSDVASPHTQDENDDGNNVVKVMVPSSSSTRMAWALVLEVGEGETVSFTAQLRVREVAVASMPTTPRTMHGVTGLLLSIPYGYGDATRTKDNDDDVMDQVALAVCESDHALYADYYVPRRVDHAATSQVVEMSETEFCAYRDLTPHVSNTTNYVVAPAEGRLRRLLLRGATDDALSRTALRRRLAEDYFWGLRVIFVPCLGHDVVQNALRAHPVTDALSACERHALECFTRSCVQLYREPAASTAYDVPCAPLSLLHLLSLVLLYAMSNDAAMLVRRILALGVVLGQLQPTLYARCAIVVHDATTWLCNVDSSTVIPCTLFAHAPYLAPSRRDTGRVLPHRMTPQERHTAAVDAVAVRMSEERGGAREVQRAAAVQYVTRVQTAALYVALRCVQHRSPIASSETTTQDKEGEDALAADVQVILSELQRETASETHRLLRRIHELAQQQEETDVTTMA